MKCLPCGLIHEHKLPSKLIELFKAAENTSLVGFGTTQEQQTFALLSALIDTQDTVFFEELNQELSDFLLTLSDSLLVNSNN